MHPGGSVHFLQLPCVPLFNRGMRWPLNCWIGDSLNPQSSTIHHSVKEALGMWTSKKKKKYSQSV